MTETKDYKLQGIFDNTRQYFDARLELLKLQATEKSARVL